MRRTVCLALLCAALGTTAVADTTPARRVDVAIPHAAAVNETATLEVQTGYLPRGTEIDVKTRNGLLIGTISPFAIHDHQPAGTYSFPLRSNDIRNGHVSVLLTLRRDGTETRAPTEAEVPQVSVQFIRTAP